MNNYDSNLFNKEEEHNNVLLNLQEHSNKTNDKKSRHKHIMNVLQSCILVLMSLLQDNNHHYYSTINNNFFTSSSSKDYKRNSSTNDLSNYISMPKN